jgi:DNA (cytosine-5)-methyltransferase 1
MRVVELFSGIGSQTQALKNIGVQHEVVAVCEIDKYAHRSYEAIHGETLNLGDITKVQKLPDCDLLTYSFPCTDLSLAGKQAGLSRNSGTRSGLLWEVERLLKCSTLPKYLLMENVKPLVGDKFIGQFNEWQAFLWSLGYRNFWQVLNAKDYSIPQNRERVFMVSILGECDGYSFPAPVRLEKRLADVLEEEVDEKYFLSEKTIAGFQAHKERNGEKTAAKTSIKIAGTLDQEHEATGRVYDPEGISPTLDTMSGGNRQPKVTIGVSNTLTTVQNDNVVVIPPRIRKLSPLEVWRLMGFTDEAFRKAEAVNSNTQLYKQAGNSIVVQVLEGIFRSLLCEDKGKVEPMQMSLF